MHDDGIHGLLAPRSIALIGASQDPTRIGGRPLEYLKRHGYRGQVYPINPKYDEIDGWRCYSAVTEVGEPIDLAIVAVGRSMVLDVLNQCAEAGVRAAVVFTAGFAESGDDGKRLQVQFAELAERSGMRILGPNCQGLANLHTASMCTFSTAFAADRLRVGSSAIVSQSGAVAAMIYNIAKSLGKGAAYWVSTGNEADVTAPEVVGAVLDDEHVRVIQLYLEDIKDGRLLVDVADKALARGKPILAVKSGRTEEGRRAASSHTGALAADDAVVDAVLRRHGVVRLEDVNELGLAAQLFELGKAPEGGRVAILTNSGGLGVMMVDRCKEVGLELANLSPQTRAQLDALLPEFASHSNPIDVTAQLLNDPDLLYKALPILLDDTGVDIVLLSLGTVGKGYDIPRLVSAAADAQRTGSGVVVVTWVGSAREAIPEFTAHSVPVFEDPGLCAKAVARYVDYHRRRLEAARPSKGGEHPAITRERRGHPQGSGVLSTYQAARLLGGHDLPMCRDGLAQSARQAGDIADSLGYPVAMKVSAATLPHKTEVGGVALDLANRKNVEAAYEQIMDRCNRTVSREEIEGVLVQEMVSGPGFEVSLGLKRTETFGPVLMVASGGIYVEVLRDFQLVVPPVTPEAATEAVLSLRMAPILSGVRGQPPLDIEALADTIVRFSALALGAEWIAEADLNPVIVLPRGEGVRIVDALVRVDHAP